MVSKLTKKTIAKICVRSFALLYKKLLNVMIGYLIYGAPSDRSHLIQDFLKTKLKRRFIRAEEGPPS